MVNKLKQFVRTRHKINYQFGYELKNIETSDIVIYYKNRNSPWLSTLSEAKAWLQTQEQLRLQGENIGRPDTKWAFVCSVVVILKAVLNRQPLQIGLEVFFAAYNIPGNTITLKHFHLLERHFKQGIAVYTVLDNGDFVLSCTPSRYDKINFPIMTVGLHASHAFLITDINKVTNNYTCGECLVRFTKSCNLFRHAKTCTRGKTVVACPGNQIQAPDSAYKKDFYPPTLFGYNAIRWIEYEARHRGIHIHHQLCGHGGERFIAGSFVDGYHPKSKTVFQYHGCYFHGCSWCYLGERAKRKCYTPTAKANRLQEPTFIRERRIEAKPFGVVVTLWLSGGNTRTTMNTSPAPGERIGFLPRKMKLTLAPLFTTSRPIKTRLRLSNQPRI